MNSALGSFNLATKQINTGVIHLATTSLRGIKVHAFY